MMRRFTLRHAAALISLILMLSLALPRFSLFSRHDAADMAIAARY